jgi:hypothetical protein
MLPQARSAETAGAPKAPAEWLDVVQRETANQKRTEDPEFRRLLLGASMALHPYNGRPEVLANLKGERKARYSPFAEWMKREGDALVEKVLHGETIPLHQRRLYFIASGVCLSRYFKQVRRKLRERAALTSEEEALRRYAEEVELRGRELLTKGYLGGSFIQGEIDELRLYAMWIDIRCTGQGVLPFHLGLTERWPSKHPPMGEPAPDFTLLRFEAALRSPDYSDRNPHDPTDVLRPAILREYLLLFEGYKPDPTVAERPRVAAKPVVVPEGREGDYVRLSDFRGSKAVLVVLANPTDSWAWHWRIAPMFEPLYQAYQQQVEFLFVNTTIHDTYMPVKDFFKPDAGRHDAVHDLTMAQRARTCKMFYMDLPQCTVPYLLDDLSQRTRNAYRDQGGGAYVVLVDLEGRVAYADYHQDIPPHWGPQAVSFHDEYVYIRMNHLESRLRRFVENGCRYDPAIETPYPTWRRRAQPAQQGQSDQDAPQTRQPMIWLTGRISSVDLPGRVLTVERHKPLVERMKGWQFWQDAGDRAVPFDPDTKARLATVEKWIAAGDAGRTYRFVVDDAVELFLHGHAVKLGELEPGDHVGVLYPTGQEGEPAIHPEQVRATRLDPQ